MTARFLTDDHARAEDLVQEALARSWRSWKHIERQDRPEVYVRRVMVNLSASWWRRRWRAEVPTDVLPESPGARDDMGEADAREVVRQSLAGLPARQRAVVVLRYLDDLTEVQTAAVMGCSVGTVKSHCARALARLRGTPALAELRSPTVQHRFSDETTAALSAETVEQVGRRRRLQARARAGFGMASTLMVVWALVRGLAPARHTGVGSVVGVGPPLWRPGPPSPAELGDLHLWRYVAEAGVLVVVAAATVVLALLAGRTAHRSWQRQVAGAWSWLLACTGGVLLGTRVGGALTETVERALQGGLVLHRLRDLWSQLVLGLVLAGAGVASRLLARTGRRLAWTSVVAEVSLVVGAAVAGEALWEAVWVLAGIVTSPWDGGFPLWTACAAGVVTTVAGVLLAIGVGVLGTRTVSARVVEAVGMMAALAAVQPGYRSAQMAVRSWQGRDIGETAVFG